MKLAVGGVVYKELDGKSHGLRARRVSDSEAYVPSMRHFFLQKMGTKGR